jgi:hypothetical protein
MENSTHRETANFEPRPGQQYSAPQSDARDARDESTAMKNERRTGPPDRRRFSRGGRRASDAVYSG